MMIKKIINTISRQTWVCYVFAAAVILISVDRNNANLMRLSMLQHYADYPIQFLFQKAGHQPEAFRYAVTYYRPLEKLFPDIPDVKMILGVCYAEIGKYKKASRYFEQAYRLREDLFWNLFNLGILKYKMHLYGEAEKIFEKIVFLDNQQLLASPFSSQLLKKYPSAVQETLVAQNIRFNLFVQSRARLMLLQCLWEQNKYQEIFTLAQHFLNQPDRPENESAYAAWASRVLLKTSSEKSLFLYARALINKYPENIILFRFTQQISSALSASQSPEHIFQNFLTVPDQFVIHPWREYILIGRELFLGKSPESAI
ncbi:MAG: tetratricopeptide repeat protein [Candidatus Omnitrophota bacterium]